MFPVAEGHSLPLSALEQFAEGRPAAKEKDLSLINGSVGKYLTGFAKFTSSVPRTRNRLPVTLAPRNRTQPFFVFQGMRAMWGTHVHTRAHTQIIKRIVLRTPADNVIVERGTEGHPQAKRAEVQLPGARAS